MDQFSFEVGRVRPIRLADINSVSARLRKADWKEITLDGQKPHNLHEALKFDYSYTIEVNGEPEGLFGICPSGLSPRAGCMWMVGTDILVRDAMYTFGKSAPKAIDWMLRKNKHYSYVFNYVHEDNRVNLAWLKRMNFTVLDDSVRLGLRFKLLIKENPYYV